MAASAQVLAFPGRPGRTADAGAGVTVDADATESRDERYLPISRLKKQLNDYLGSKHAENEEAQQADMYFHAVQWTEKERKVLADRNQPEVVFNRIKRKINTVVGVLEKARQDPKGWPRNPTPGSEDGSELCTKTLRYALGWDWQDKSADVARKCAVRAISGLELVLTPTENGDPEIELDLVDQRDYFYDPRSGKRDFSDARFEGTTRWIDTDEAIFKWPEAEEDLKGLRESAPANWDKDDSRQVNWYSRTEDQVRIVDHWYKRGDTWFYCIYVGDIILEEGESPFRDSRKRSISKYIMMSCEVDHDNDRYAFFRDWKGPQDEINHRRSKGLHALNSRRIIAEVGAVDDVDLARREAVRSDGFLLKNKGYDLQIVENTADVQQNMEMLQEAKNEIDSYGPNPGLIGTTVDAASGRAIALLQAAGIAELGTFMLTFKTWKLRVYRAVWNACQQFWTAERFITVTDQEGMPEFVKVNGWERDEYGFPVIINQLAQLDVDIILDEGPDTINSMADTYDTMLAMGQAGAQIPPEVIIELSALPGSVKKKVMQMLAQAQQPKPMDEQALVLKLQDVMADIQKKQASAALDTAKIGQIEAETMRGPDGAPAQVDTPADMAKAALDLAKAQEIQHKIQQPPERQGGLFDADEQQARVRQIHAQAAETEQKSQRTAVETGYLAQYGAAEPAKIPPKNPPGAR